MSRRLTLDELEALPTLSVGQSCNLKIDEGDRRIWLSRCTVADGEPFDNAVTVETLVDGRWVDFERYPAVLS